MLTDFTPTPKQPPPKIDFKAVRSFPQVWENYAYDILNEIEKIDSCFEEETIIARKSNMTLKLIDVVQSQILDMDPDWREFFEEALEEGILPTISEAIDGPEIVYPPLELVFRFAFIPLKRIRVIIIGQDPYHGQGQACGLAFSVREGCRLPPSLVNIFKELYSDLGIKNKTGDLTKWAIRGVLLLNTSFTVVEGKPNSHADFWQEFTSKLLKFLNDRLPNAIIVCWGKHAQNAARSFSKQIKINSAHPSPYSANSGFFGSKPFSKINAELKRRGELPINWRV